MNSPLWQYNEFRQVGTDYEDPKHVEAYDKRHAQFRDVDAECIGILDRLGLGPQSVVIEMGTGTGAFAIRAAHFCANVYAVDVSISMLGYARMKADKEKLSNIEFCHGGFLTYAHAGAPADALVTGMALHHLPDFWKSIALGRMNGMLKPGGKLFINDVVFEEKDAIPNILRWLDQLGAVGGQQLRDEVSAHVREEYSTLDWIMDGLLERSGFSIRSKEMTGGVLAKYLCVKTAEAASPSNL